MKLRYRSSAYFDVFLFVSRYEEYFVELYDDTGMWNEESMLKDARARADQLFTDIYDTVDQHLVRDPVVGRKKIQSNIYQLVFDVGSRIIFVYYSEDKTANTRWVESVSIGRKPIIF